MYKIVNFIPIFALSLKFLPMEKKYIILCQDDLSPCYNLTGEAHTKEEALRIIEEYKKEYPDDIYNIKEI